MARYGHTVKGESDEPSAPLGHMNWCSDPIPTDAVHTFNPEGYRSRHVSGEGAVRPATFRNRPYGAVYESDRQFDDMNARKGFGEEDDE